MATVLAIALQLLLVGAFISLDREARMEAEHYAKALVGIYSDLVVYDSSNSGRPADMSFKDKYDFFGDYMCSWYRVDYIYAYVPDLENGTISFISVVRNKDNSSLQTGESIVAGMSMPYTMTENELKAWNGEETFAVEKKDWLVKNTTDVLIPVVDEYGNKAMAGASITMKGMYHEMIRGFMIVALFMILIIVLLALHMHYFVKRDVSKPAQRISETMSEYISQGKRSTIRLESDDSDEFSMIAGAFNHMNGEIDKYIDDIERMGREKERQQAEIDIASEIQKGILSSGSASMSSCGIKAMMKPAKYIGGDLYDYLSLDESHTMIVVADVSGKGISSAMLMSLSLAHIRQFAKMGYSPAGILRNINDIFSDENPQMMFVTAFVAIYDSENHTLTYANAGHNPPYLIHDGLELLDGSDGTPLGLFQGEEYTDVVVRMEAGDSVFLYTDGVNEAVNASGEFYGTERLERVLADAFTSDEKNYLQTVENSVAAFVGETEQNDDITMLVLYARKNPVLELDYDVNQFSLIRDRLFASRLPKDLVMNLCVAAEECFVNICSYAFDGPAPEGEKIQFYFEYSKKVVMRFIDGGRQFDPREGLPDTEEYDIDTAIGGLGRLIAFTIADTVDYEYKDGKNILTITISKV